MSPSNGFTTSFDKYGDFMVNFDFKDRYDINDLMHIIELLRSENGCPWDKVQTHESIRTDLIEETYEVCEGIDKNSPEMLREELGDLLLQIVFHAQIERENGTFDFDDVCNDICQKLVYRHPHVFGEVKADDTDTVLKNWDALKKESKHQETYAETLESVPKTFPALQEQDCLLMTRRNALPQYAPGLINSSRKAMIRSIRKINRHWEICCWIFVTWTEF